MNAITVAAAPLERANKTAASDQGAGGVQSLHRALSLLDALAEGEDGLSLTALAKKVG